MEVCVMRRTTIVGLLLFSLLISLPVFGQGNSENARTKNADKQKNDKDDHDDEAPIKVGYVIVTPTAAGTRRGDLVLFATFGVRKGDETTQAGLLPTDLTTQAVMFMNTDGKLSRNLGIGIVNPNTTAASLTMTLRGEDGVVVGTKTFTVRPQHQTAELLTSMFADRPEVPRDLTGTLRVTSDIPVSIVGLRFRGENFSTIPVTNLAPTTTIPARGTGIGGANALVLPHFAADGGWATELVLLNTGAERIVVRADFFDQAGEPMTVRLNGESKSTFTDLTVPAGGLFELSPKTGDGRSRF
jgi:hypothetical protein